MNSFHFALTLLALSLTTKFVDGMSCAEFKLEYADEISKKVNCVNAGKKTILLRIIIELTYQLYQGVTSYLYIYIL